MEALIQFWLNMKPFTLTDQDRQILDEGFDSWDKRFSWMKENGERIGLPKGRAFIFWDKSIRAFYIQEMNDRRIDYLPEGFETPDYLPDPVRFPIEAVTATVSFESIDGILNGVYEVQIEESGDTVKAVLSIHTFEKSVVCHTLHIDRCPSLKSLSKIACLIRSGATTPKVLWP